MNRPKTLAALACVVGVASRDRDDQASLREEQIAAVTRRPAEVIGAVAGDEVGLLALD